MGKLMLPSKALIQQSIWHEFNFKYVSSPNATIHMFTVKPSLSVLWNQGPSLLHQIAKAVVSCLGICKVSYNNPVDFPRSWIRLPVS